MTFHQTFNSTKFPGLEVTFYYSYCLGDYWTSSSYTFDIEKVTVVDSDICFEQYCLLNGLDEKEVDSQLSDEIMEYCHESA